MTPAPMPKPRITAVFGATSGIAMAYARLRARAGDALILVARSESKLNAFCAKSTDLDLAAKITPVVFDFTRIDRLRALVAKICVEPVDNTLIAFGILPGQNDLQQQPLAYADTVTVNFTAPAILIEELIKQRPAGDPMLRIGMISSVAGDRGSDQYDGATKAAISTWTQELVHRLSLDTGAPAVSITTLKPGLVATAMTSHVKDRSGRIWASPEQVTRDCDCAMNKGKTVVYSPGYWRPLMFIVRSLPAWLAHKIRA